MAAGNCFILKPSERVPMTNQRLVQLAEQAGFPPGVVSLVNGGREAVEALCDHPRIRAISFVGSTPVGTLGESAFGCAGQRCLATSVATPVGAAREPFLDGIAELARLRRVGYGLDEGTEMGR